MKKISYITNDPWWDTDITIFPTLGRFFDLNVFVVSYRHYNKKYPVKESKYTKTIHEYERKYRLSNLLNIFFSLRLVRDIKFSGNKNDIFFYVFGDDPYFNLLFLLFFPTKRTIISFHNYIEHADNPFFEKIFKRLIIKRFKHFHFHSQSQHEKFQKEHFDKNVFFTEMKMKDFGPASGKIKIKTGNKRTFLFFGYIRDYKRVDLFIDAANNLNGNSHFVIAGTCKDWDLYKNRIKQKEKFTCDIEFIDNQHIPDYFSQADFLVLPYTDTTQSGPLLIAYHYHLPVIASNLDVFTEMVQHGHNGYIFESGNAKALEECMKIASYLSDSEYEKLKENQRKMAKAYQRRTNNIGLKFNSFIEKHIGQFE